MLHAAATGALAEHPPPRWRPDAAITVVVAAEGYPGTPRTGDAIGGLEAAAAVPGVDVLHAGTAWRDGAVVSAGGRVLSVTAVGADLAHARTAAYAAVDHISLRGSFHRRDIAERAAAGATTPAVAPR